MEATLPKLTPLDKEPARHQDLGAVLVNRLTAKVQVHIRAGQDAAVDQVFQAYRVVILFRGTATYTTD